jgi:hypothetical protein
MILKSRIKKHSYDETKTQVKFAWFPTKMRLEQIDKNGEIIWLEKYIKTSYWDGCGWGFKNKKRYDEELLKKLSE